MHALTRNGQVDRIGSIPRSFTRPDGTSVSNYDTLPETEHRADGWRPVTERKASLSAGQQLGEPTYTVRADDVLADYPAVPEPAEVTNERTLRQQALAALVANRAFIAQAKPGTAAAQASSAYDQAKSLTRQMNGVIRLLLGQLDGTD